MLNLIVGKQFGEIKKMLQWSMDIFELNVDIGVKMSLRDATGSKSVYFFLN